MSVCASSVGAHCRLRTASTYIALFVTAFVFSANAFAHGGAVDKNGCHLDRSSGERHCHRKSKSICDGKVPTVADEDVLHGRVVSVTDGDTFKAKLQGAVMKFRMADIDAPELDQPYGREARARLAAAMDGKDVVMLLVDNDPYGRLVVHVWIANLHINREVMALGGAWYDREYAHDDCLYQVENESRTAKRGLWKLPLEERVEPWIWRESKRDSTGTRHRKKTPTR